MVLEAGIYSIAFFDFYYRKIIFLGQA